MFFYQLFYSLEDAGLLDINKSKDLKALHVAFMPLIQRQLNSFRYGWANHPLRTEHNRTPQQLWIMGMHSRNETDPMDETVTGLSEVFK